MGVIFFNSASGRSPPLDFLRALEADDRAYILSDLQRLEREGDKAPISKKPIKGHKPMWEVRTGGYRTFFVRQGEAFTVLHVCKKQDQRRGIEVAATRMKHVLGGG